MEGRQMCQAAFEKFVGLVSVGAVCIIPLTPGDAVAGGFAIHDQSTLFLGSSLAGAAAGGSLSSMFWNSAATAELSGMNMDASYTYIVVDAEIKVESARTTGVAAALFNPVFAQAAPESGDFVPDPLIAASYGNYQVNDKLFVGIGLNSPFGLKTEPADQYMGSPLGRRTSLMVINANPTIAYKVVPGVTLGAGAQIEYADGTFKFATGVPVADSTVFGAEDWAFGATAGIMLRPFEGTTIGLGWRSQLTHTFEGSLNRHATSKIPVPGLPASIPAIGALAIGGETELNLPDIVTLSFRQTLATNMRLMGTIEWTNWSRFEKLELKATEAGINPVTNLPVSEGDVLATIEANWDDGWHFALGGEYDYSANLTLRSGIAYEIAPVQNPEQRLTTTPDANRFWISAGASFKYSETTTFDIAYIHVFVEEGDFERTTLGNPAIATTLIKGNIDAHADTISVGMRTKW
jgi:long-chain fatty acid transport protein